MSPRSMTITLTEDGESRTVDLTEDQINAVVWSLSAAPSGNKNQRAAKEHLYDVLDALIPPVNA